MRRTRADAVAAVYDALLEQFAGPGDVVADPQRFSEAVHTLGLAWRTSGFVEACAVLVRKHGGKVPEAREELEELPGVGHYTAGAIRCFGFDVRETLVDTNTIRLAARLGGQDLDTGHHRTASVHRAVASLAPGGAGLVAGDNYALLDLAAAVCRPRLPDCGRCPLRADCHTGSGA